MADILKRIEAYKREEIAAAKQRVPPAEMAKRARAAGPTRGFLDGLTDAEIVQHRLLALLPAALGVLEWLIQTGRLRDTGWARAIALMMAVGGGLLLAHAHPLVRVKESYLMEVTHLPLGLLAVLIGWARWLELRLPPGDGHVAARVWPPAMALVGLSPKVTGRSRLIPARGPTPGRTPTSVPTRQPANAYTSTSGESAVAKPVPRFCSISTIGSASPRRSRYARGLPLSMGAERRATGGTDPAARARSAAH